MAAKQASAGERAASSDRPDRADVDEVATRLYGLAPEEFTEARNAEAKAARGRGDPRGAQAIAALRKPTTVGWLANQLVREYRDEVAPLLELGASLREATTALDRDQLRELSRQQHQVVRALVRQAAGIASAAGRAVSSETARGLEETLAAALADPDAARRLSDGRLSGGLSHGGFPGVEDQAPSGGGAAKAGEPTGPPPEAAGAGRRARRGREDPGGDRDAARRRRIDAAAAHERDARAEADEAAGRQRAARAERDQAERAARDAAETVAEVRRRLDEVSSEQIGVDRRLRAARREAGKADRAARDAARRLGDAEQRHRRLTG